MHGHPWGGVDESATMTGLDLPPPSRGQRCVGSLFGFAGEGPGEPRRIEARTGRVRWRPKFGQGELTTGAVVLAIGRKSRIDRTVPSYQGIVSLSTRSRRRPTTSTTIRGHRDDQSDYRSCSERHGSGLPWHGLRPGALQVDAHASGALQGRALPPGPHEVPAGPLEVQPPGPGQVPAGARQVRPAVRSSGPGQVRPAELKPV